MTGRKATEVILKKFEMQNIYNVRTIEKETLDDETFLQTF